MSVPGIKILSSALALLVILTACDKANLDPVTQLKVRLTDAPVYAQQVNVHIKEVRVNLANDTAWTILNTNSATYNLLNYQDGKDTLIAQGNVRATSTVKEIRLILGDSNTIKINNDIFPLSVVGSSQGGFKILTEKKMNKNIETVVLDFDAGLSVIELSKGNYQLSPVIKLK